MKCFATAALAWCLSCGCPAAAHATAGAVQIAVEPGLASLARPREQRSWGLLGGASVSVQLADLISLQLHVDHKIFINQEPELTIDTWGLALVYAVDLGMAVPVVEIGLAGVMEKRVDQPAPPPELVLQIGAGINFFVNDWFFVGVIFRYYPFLGTDLLAPAYTGINARVGVLLGG